jgi:hypothetical protein
MWFLVIMISSTLLLVDANRVGIYGPYPTQTTCEQAGRLFTDTGMTPSGSYVVVDKKNQTAMSTCTQSHKVQP